MINNNPDSFLAGPLPIIWMVTICVTLASLGWFLSRKKWYRLNRQLMAFARLERGTDSVVLVTLTVFSPLYLREKEEEDFYHVWLEPARRLGLEFYYAASTREEALEGLEETLLEWYEGVNGLRDSLNSYEMLRTKVSFRRFIDGLPEELPDASEGDADELTPEELLDQSGVIWSSTGMMGGFPR